MESMSSRIPSGIELLWHDEAERRSRTDVSAWDDHFRQGFYLGRTGDLGWAGFSVRRVYPWIEGVDLGLADDLTLLADGLETLLDQAADEISEATRSAWPDRTFPKPHARVENGVLRMWFGDEARPVLDLPEIDLHSAIYRD
jgi:hypothetical protein